ncbi:hypothetical protein QOT17_016893 [Balamuthia mandrillaris]
MFSQSEGWQLLGWRACWQHDERTASSDELLDGIDGSLLVGLHTRKNPTSDHQLLLTRVLEDGHGVEGWQGPEEVQLLAFSSDKRWKHLECLHSCRRHRFTWPIGGKSWETFLKPQSCGPQKITDNKTCIQSLNNKVEALVQQLQEALEDTSSFCSSHSDGLSEELHHIVGKEESQPSKEAYPFWKKLLRQQANEDSYDDETSGAFTYLPSLDRLSWSGDTQKEAIGELVLRTMRESLLFVTLVSIGWQFNSWDDFLIGLSPLSGRLVGLHTLTGSFGY